MDNYSRLYYCYFWLREDGTPYYVGKGVDFRGFGSGDHSVHCPEKSRITIQYYASESEAYTAEIFFIAFYGRKDLGTGCLRNKSDGGEAPPNVRGIKRSPAFCKQIGLRSRKRKRTRTCICYGCFRPFTPRSDVSKNAVFCSTVCSAIVQNKYKLQNTHDRIVTLETREKQRSGMLVSWEKKRVEGDTKHRKPSPMLGRKHEKPSPLIGRKRDPEAVRKVLETRKKNNLRKLLEQEIAS